MNTAPKRFVICTTARSGSNLVCDYIANTARLGKPTEFLNPDIVRHGAYGRRFDAPEPISVTDYVNWVATTHATPNGVCGMKLLFEDFEFLGGYPTVRDFLSEAIVIRLIRRSKLSQAISYYMAQQTGQWVSTDPARIPAEEICFDFDAIHEHLKRLCHQDAMWDGQLDCLGIVAEHWVFEEFLGDPGRYVRGLGEKMGAYTADMQIKTDIKKQSNAQSDLFKAQFIARMKEERYGADVRIDYENMAFRA